jgi:hypothetical protein
MSPNSAGTDGEIERPHPVAAFVEQPLELVPALIGARVDRNVEQPLEKAVDLVLGIFSILEMLLERIAGEIAISRHGPSPSATRR